MTLRAAAFFATLALVIGVVHLVAWRTGAAAGWVEAGGAVVKANTALCFVMGGLALLLMVWRPAGRGGRAIAAVLSLLVVAVAGLSFAENALDRDLGITRLLLAAPAAETLSATTLRVGPFGALSLTLLGFAILGLWGRSPRVGQALAVAAAAVVLVPVIGVLYGIGIIRDLASANQVVWLGVVGILALASGVVLASPGRGMMVLLTADDPGGLLLRRLLLPALLVPMLLGWLRTLAAQHTTMDGPTGTGLLIAALALFTVAMLWRAANQVNDWARRQQEAARELTGSRRSWQQLAEAMPQFVWTCTAAGDCDYISPRWLDYTGLRAADDYVLRWLDRVHPDDTEYLISLWQAALAADTEFAAEFRLRRHDGQWRWFMARALPVRGDDGVTIKWYGSSTDIDDLKRTQEALREMLHRFELLAETAHSLLSSRDPRAAGDLLCQRVMAHLGCDFHLNYLLDGPSGDLRLNSWSGLDPSEVSALTSIGMGEAVCGWVASRGERLVVAEVGASDDSRFAMLREQGLRAYACHPLLAPGGETIGTLSFGTRTRDAFSAEDLQLMHAVADQLATAVWRIRVEQKILEQERHFRETLEQRVVARTAELQRMTLELTRAEQRERNRLAELLHDGLQQLLVAAKLHVGLVTGAADDTVRGERARDLVDLLHDALASTRTLTGELSPPALRDQGLVAALHWLADWMQTKHQLRVDVTVDAPGEPRDPTVRTLLYQCARELLLNVVKYAGVAETTLRLDLSEAGDFRLVVRDGGHGFDPALVTSRHPESFGLASIRRRIELVGGRVRVDSTLGRGTEVRIEVSLGAPIALADEGVA